MNIINIKFFTLSLALASMTAFSFDENGPGVMTVDRVMTDAKNTESQSESYTLQKCRSLTSDLLATLEDELFKSDYSKSCKKITFKAVSFSSTYRKRGIKNLWVIQTQNLPKFYTVDSEISVNCTQRAAENHTSTKEVDEVVFEYNLEESCLHSDFEVK